MDQTLTTRRRVHWSTEVIKYVFSIAILGMGLAVLVALVMLRQPPEKRESDALVPLVQTSVVTPYQGKLDMIVSGSVVPFREISIAPEVGGVIVEKFPDCEPGKFVKRGQPLFQIDKTDYELDLKALDYEIAQAKKSLEETQEEIEGAIRNLELAQTDYELQEREYQRIKSLSNAVSASELDQAARALLAVQTTLTNRRNQLQLLQAREARMQAALELVMARREKTALALQRTRIVAKDDGIIVSETVEPGNYATPGSPLVFLEVTRRAEIRCNLAPSELEWLRKYASMETVFDQDAQMAVYQLPRLDVDVYEKQKPQIVWRGVLERFEGIGRDERTKTIPTTISVDRPVVPYNGDYYALVRGMYVKCRIEIDPAQTGDNRFVAFPEIGLRPGNYVWTVVDDKLHRVQVEVVDRVDIQREGQNVTMVITTANDQGLKQGDAVVTSPVPQPLEGSPVIVQNDGVESQPAETQASPTETNEQPAEPAEPTESAKATKLRGQKAEWSVNRTAQGGQS